MGIESLHPRLTFGIEDLGLLDAAPSRPVDTIVGLCADAVRPAAVAFFVFDDVSASLVVRSASGSGGVRPGMLSVHRGAASAIVREELAPLPISDLGQHPDTMLAAERRQFGAVGYLGAPVFGPAGEAIGVLAAMTMFEHAWSRRERDLVQEYAFLLSEQIMLKAALQTVKLMARERATYGAPRRFCN